MHNRSFGKDELSVSELGLGCWQLGGAEWGNVSEEEAHRILDVALENGITFYDTADVYGDGRSEKLVGQFIKKQSKQGAKNLFVATKVGRRDLVYPNQYTRENVTGCIDRSLRNLGVETLDLVQTHCVPTDVVRDGEVFEILRELRTAGKIRRFGASVESMEEAMLCMEHPDMYSLQIIFNVLRQKALQEVLPLAAEKRIGIIVRLPLNSGLLSGKFNKRTTFVETDHRHFNRDGQAFNVGETFGGLPFEKGLELVDELRSYVPSGVPMSQFALRWCLDQLGVSVVIPGATRAEQIANSAKASKIPPLSATLLQTLRAFYDDKVRSHIRGAY